MDSQRKIVEIRRIKIQMAKIYSYIKEKYVDYTMISNRFFNQEVKFDINLC